MKRIRLPLRAGRVYILPTRMGLTFLLGIIVVVMSGATYSNNLIYALGFYMFSVFIVSMVQTHLNLRDIEVEVLSLGDGYSGETLKVNMRVINRGRVQRQLIEFSSTRSKIYGEGIARLPHLDSQAAVFVAMDVPCRKRGVFEAPRVEASTRYPLGVFRAWKMVQVDKMCYVYPEPKGADLKVAKWVQLASSAEAMTGYSGGGDFREHRLFQAGDSYRRVDWKALARERPMLIKQFDGESDHLYRFSFLSLGGDIEARLKQLSFWIREASAKRLAFELVMPAETFRFSEGPAFVQKCLRGLAMFEGKDGI